MGMKRIIKRCEACGKPLAKNCQKRFRFHPECLPTHPKYDRKNKKCLACGKPLKKGADARTRYHARCLPSRQKRATLVWKRTCAICEKPLFAKKWNQKTHHGKCMKLYRAKRRDQPYQKRSAHLGASLPDREYRSVLPGWKPDWGIEE